MKHLAFALLLLVACRDETAPTTTSTEADGGSGGSSTTAATTSTTASGTGGAPETGAGGSLSVSGAGGTATSSTTGTGGSGGAPETGVACFTETFCEYPRTSAECATIGWAYSDHCPTLDLIGCCGDSVPLGGFWDCYYPGAEAAAAASKQVCNDWQETSP
jgi:hypothetical protein